MMELKALSAEGTHLGESENEQDESKHESDKDPAEVEEKHPYARFCCMHIEKAVLIAALIDIIQLVHDFFTLTRRFLGAGDPIFYWGPVEAVVLGLCIIIIFWAYKHKHAKWLVPIILSQAGKLVIHLVIAVKCIFGIVVLRSTNVELLSETEKREHQEKVESHAFSMVVLIITILISIFSLFVFLFYVRYLRDRSRRAKLRRVDTA